MSDERFNNKYWRLVLVWFVVFWFYGVGEVGVMALVKKVLISNSYHVYGCPAICDAIVTLDLIISKPELNIDIELIKQNRACLIEFMKQMDNLL